jgi:hypothetical protein
VAKAGANGRRRGSRGGDDGGGAGHHGRGSGDGECPARSHLRPPGEDWAAAQDGAATAEWEGAAAESGGRGGGTGIRREVVRSMGTGGCRPAREEN